MKKVLSTIAILATVTAGFAQGVINYNAASFPIFSTNSGVNPLFGGSAGVNGTAPGNATSTYYFALLITAQTAWQVAPTDTSVWDSSWVNSGIVTSNGASANGRLLSAGASIPTGSILNNLNQAWNGNNTPTGGPAGVTNGIVLAGWSSNLGSSWSSVAAILNAVNVGNLAPLIAQIGVGNTAFFGESAFGYLAPNSGAPAAALFAAAATPNGLPINNPGTSPITLYALPTPEPGTMALAGLGALSLMLFRRNRK